ncbi:MAG: PaaI family thioesterase [candidate division Zixibacteria bacterium]|nr:PaaI family thioesterase [candidate division Zixibacteria bacterium]MBU1471685.1 PaaI family thioesterase [candidate division Zixibacteria bacterium]MBU2625419.1 PaaI family thioesterase [candidate division Zixibacteria bacterium]
MKEVVRYKDCFVCGEQNEIGLKAKFFVRDDGAVISKIVADARFQGYKDVLHGGIISSMLDEVMIKAVLAKGVFAVTAEMTVKFKRPVLTGQKISFTGTVTEERRRVFKAVGSAVNDLGEEVASSKATYLEAKGDLYSILTESIE